MSFASKRMGVNFAFRALLDDNADQVADMYIDGTLDSFVHGWVVAACQLSGVISQEAAGHIYSWCASCAEDAARNVMFNRIRVLEEAAELAAQGGK